MMMSLQRLSQMLDEHYGIPPIILLDEYDTPIQQGHMRGFYDKVNYPQRVDMIFNYYLR